MARAQKAFANPILLPRKDNAFGVGFRLRRPTAKQQGHGTRGSPAPHYPMAGGRGLAAKRLSLLS